MTATLTAPTVVAPTMADAERAAAAVLGGGAACVMLFGSVAREQQTEQSDIDLVAVFDDLGDYEERWSIKGQLQGEAQEATGHRVDLHVTDWPEWEHRSTRMKTTFESGVRSDALVLAGTQTPGPNIDWDKEIALPRTDWGEASHYLFDAQQALRLLITIYCSEPSDEPSTPSPEINPQDPARQRYVGVCSQAHSATENSLTALIHCQGQRRPMLTHKLHELLALVADPARSQIETALERIRNLEGRPKKEGPFINWRVHGTYVANYQPIPVNAAITDDHVLAALETARIAIDEIAQTIDDERISLVLTTLDRAFATYHTINIATGKPYPKADS